MIKNYLRSSVNPNKPFMTDKPLIDDYVLYADDDDDDKMVLRESFEQYAVGKTLVTVSTGQELLDYLTDNMQQRGLPCLVILDQNMPGLTGVEVVKVLREHEWFRNIPLVMFSTNQPMQEAILKEYRVPVEIKPNSFQQWEKIALRLLSHCSQFKKENPNDNK
jgi:CheY-like chemotaxis protein